MSEHAIMGTLREHVLRQWPSTHWQRLEDKLSVGIPDVSAVIPGLGEWWVEGKHVRDWPVLPGTPVRLGLSTEQRLWLLRRQALGSRVIVFAKVHKMWLAFNDHFERIHEGMPSSNLIDAAYWHSERLDVTSVFS